MANPLEAGKYYTCLLIRSRWKREGLKSPKGLECSPMTSDMSIPGLPYKSSIDATIILDKISLTSTNSTTLPSAVISKYCKVQ